MACRDWRLWCGAVIVAIGVWGSASGGVQAEPDPACRHATNEPSGAEAAGCGGAAAQSAPSPHPTPLPPCPIQVPGGVICYGPEFPGYPPDGKSVKRFLPVVAWLP